MTPVLELHEVSKVYGSGPAEVRALTGVNLSVRAGEMVAIMGLSGSGKSTLLTIAGGLEQPTSGTVLIEGEPLSGMSRSDQARMRRRHVGYVFQDFNLADESSGALDTRTGEAVIRLLRTACNEGAAAVLATHDAQLAAWADRVVFVRDGVAIDQTNWSSSASPAREAVPRGTRRLAPWQALASERGLPWPRRT
jgi:ABC-type lipoprotein export system ATPase subunit